jgi:competence protein ComEC
VYFKIPRLRSGEPDFGRNIYARISRVDFLSNSKWKRASIEFDGIDAEEVDAAKDVERELFGEDSFRPFALARIITTTNRFEDFLGAPPTVGAWFWLRIEPTGSGLMTWRAQLAPDGYYAQDRLITTNGGPLIDPLAEPRGPRPRPLGAAASKQTLPTSIAELSNRFTVGTNWNQIRQLLKTVPLPSEIVIRDVGQASFASFVNTTQESYLHFDTGLPVSWNAHTAPKMLTMTLAKDQIVVISHFDWDHIHAPYNIRGLFDAKWIVPSQRLGPGAARLAIAIAKRGNLFVWPSGAVFTNSVLSIAECAGPANNLNNSGLALRATLLSGKKALLSGDADYNNIPSGLNTPADYLLVTHHGAAMSKGSSPVGNAGIAGFAAVSFGARNTYRHPNAATKRVHTSAGWPNWRTTARNGSSPRGDVSFK